MASDAKSIILRFEQLASARSTFEATWQSIADDLLGRRDFQTKRTPGERRDQNLYDGTGMQAADTLAAALQGMMTNPATRWFELRAEDAALNEDDEVSRWLESAEDVMYTAFGSAEGGHAQACHEFYTDLSAFGSAGMFIGDAAGMNILYSARALGEMFVSENAAGRVDSVYRKFTYTARQAHQEFGDEAGSQVHKAISDNKPDQPFEFIHVVAPRDAYDTSKKNGINRQFASCYVALSDKKIVSEGGFDELPFVFARWTKDAGEVYGRGPGWNALADQKMVNAMSKTVIKAAQKIVDPPLMVADDGVVLPVRTLPGGLNFGRMDGNRADFIRPLVTGGRVDIGLEMMEQRRAAVRGAFYSHVLEMMRDPRMTAAQVYAIQGEMMRIMGPVVGRLQSEFLGPMIDRTFAILYRRGEFGELPDALSGQAIKVEYVSPMAKAQKQSQVEAILRTYEPAMQMAAIDPSVMDNLDHDEALRMLAEANGAPLKILKDRKVVEGIRQARAQQAQAQAQMAGIEQLAGAAGKAVPAIKSLMEQPAEGVA